MRWAQVLLVGLALLEALVPSAVFAADTRKGNVVTVGPAQVINDDLYAFGGTIDILGRVNGDVVAIGGNVTMRRTVTGDLTAAGGQLPWPGPGTAPARRRRDRGD